jgi:hypothetical protein
MRDWVEIFYVEYVWHPFNRLSHIWWLFKEWIKYGCWHKWTVTVTRFTENGSPTAWSYDCPKCKKHFISSELGKYQGIPIIVSGESEG